MKTKSLPKPKTPQKREKFPSRCLRLTVTIPSDLCADINAIATADDLNRSAVVRRALRFYHDARENAKRTPAAALSEPGETGRAAK